MPQINCRNRDCRGLGSQSGADAPLATMEAKLRVKKPPACDRCKARRVLCHPERPCPRCEQRNEICVTTPTVRGRPRKHPVELPPTFDTRLILAQNSEHCFEGLKFNAQYNHPLVGATTIKADIRTAEYRLELLPPPQKVLALCIVCAISLTSFHPSILGPEYTGVRPLSFDHLPEFLHSTPHEGLLSCGVRRAPIFFALRNEALKAAWEYHVPLQPSPENAVSCYLLDLMEQVDFNGVSRPWATAYMSHLRVLASSINSSIHTPISAGLWSAFFTVDALHSATTRTPMLVTVKDQFLLCGPEPPSLNALLSSVEKPSLSQDFGALGPFVQPILLHVTNLARELLEKMTGDFARLEPISESIVIQFISSLSTMHNIISHIFERAEPMITPSFECPSVTVISENSGLELLVRVSLFSLVHGFTGLVLPFLRELEYRETAVSYIGLVDSGTRARLALLRTQTRRLAWDAASQVVKALKLLPPVHNTPMQFLWIYSWAVFCLEDVEEAVTKEEPISAEMAWILEALSEELKVLGYSVRAVVTTVANSSVTNVIERLDSHVGSLRAKLANNFGIVELPPTEQEAEAWLADIDATILQAAESEIRPIYDIDLSLSPFVQYGFHS
ncbi:Zn(2)-C6 fungal-type domain-containing protein [Mycena indigotica]|uniref:Zn(2)-C6 fungal-type domain-containing protein n=1 Tax=Mycena indigotica TaxID=2126181 RepID=A0A8H6VWE1_9AGAR|nr:Zn(2)-C6 fungal-type domain-containing protein [Mycena indigotica]KAF7290679.1 Zn(2)-C6 fungal-type domain-containing protein [Mycena indigotica]